MVGTGRIELPTSSVSRKRSPTELRACETGRGTRLRAQSLNIKSIIPGCVGQIRRPEAAKTSPCYLSSARDRFYYQFSELVST